MKFKDSHKFYRIITNLKKIFRCENFKFLKTLNYLVEFPKFKLNFLNLITDFLLHFKYF